MKPQSIKELPVCEAPSATNEVYIDFPGSVVKQEQGSHGYGNSVPHHGCCHACIDALLCCNLCASCFNNWCVCFRFAKNCCNQQ